MFSLEIITTPDNLLQIPNRDRMTREKGPTTSRIITLDLLWCRQYLDLSLCFKDISINVFLKTVVTVLSSKLGYIPGVYFGLLEMIF